MSQENTTINYITGRHCMIWYNKKEGHRASSDAKVGTFPLINTNTMPAGARCLEYFPRHAINSHRIDYKGGYPSDWHPLNRPFSTYSCHVMTLPNYCSYVSKQFKTWRLIFKPRPIFIKTIYCFVSDWSIPPLAKIYFSQCALYIASFSNACVISSQ